MLVPQEASRNVNYGAREKGIEDCEWDRRCELKLEQEVGLKECY